MAGVFFCARAKRRDRNTGGEEKQFVCFLWVGGWGVREGVGLVWCLVWLKGLGLTLGA